MAPGSHVYVDAALLLAVLAGDVANYCDHAEHNEPCDIEDVRRAGEELRLIALELSARVGRDPVELYAERLAQIERRNVRPEAGVRSSLFKLRTTRPTTRMWSA
jgi:hypothetical protein